ncbi:MFS transporter [Priestia megaterium]|uniref:MFS transporter n=1 Tax=Priestia megaterium TaxID=1404 RepID=UPI0035DECB3D
MDILKNRNTVLFLLASGLSFLGNGMHFIAITWLAYSISGGPLAVGVLVAIGAVPGILTAPFTGVFADRYDKKKISIAMDVLRALIVLVMALIIDTNNTSLTLLYIFSVLLSSCSNFFYPAISGMIKECIIEELYFRTITLNSTLQQLGFILGPALGGLLISLFSIRTVLYVDALTFLGSGLLLLFLSYKPSASSKEIIKNKAYNSIWKDFQGGFSYVKSNRFILYLVFLGIVGATVVNTFNSLLSDYTSSLGHGVKVYGIFDTVFGVGSVLTGFSLAFLSKKLGKRKVIIFSYCLMALALCIIGFSNQVWISILAIVFLGASIMGEGVSRKTLLIESVDKKYIGRVESLNWVLISSIAPLLSIIGSLLSEYLSSKIILGILCIPLLIISYFATKVLRLNTYKGKHSDISA